jgi:hypothetical protein
MPTTPMGIPWPNENLDPFYAKIAETAAHVDMIREDADLLFENEGGLTLAGDVASWANPLYIVCPRLGTKITVAAGSVSVADGQFLYVTPLTRPITNSAGAMVAGSTLPVGSIVLGVRLGTSLYMRGQVGSGSGGGDGKIYLDAVDGSDVSGDGTPGKPFKSLEKGMDPSVVPVPASWAEFDTAVQYVLAPGTYTATGDVQVPYRRNVLITGSRFVIDHRLNWYYQLQYWFGHNPDLEMATFKISTDTLGDSQVGDVYRMNEAADDSAGRNCVLSFERLLLSGDIINADSGNVDADTQATGPAFLQIIDCQSEFGISEKVIGGQDETNFPGKINEWRHIFQTFRDTNHSIVGNNTICEWHQCYFKCDYVSCNYDIFMNSNQCVLCGDASFMLSVVDSQIMPTAEDPAFGRGVSPP